MAGMKRFVTYIYYYEDRKKGNNVGFARVDIRGEESRVEIHLRGIYPGRCNCTVFLIKEEEESLVGVPIGELKIMNGNGDFGTIVKAGQIGESPFGLPDMEGVFLLGEDDRIFMSRWREGTVSDIDRACFREWRSEPQQETPEHVSDMVSSNSSGIQSGGTRLNASGRRATGIHVNKAVAGLQLGEAGTQTNHTDNSQDENESLTATEIPMRNIFPEYNWLAVWESLQKNHPVCSPFEDSDIICARIELKDLRDLPRRYWYLGNNSFLLHGYFNYQHLMIGKLKEERWFIGIPGIYQRQERVMAAIFGFSEFLPAAVEEPREDNGEPINRYGYWYRFIEE